jgi:hypothetical protein
MKIDRYRTLLSGRWAGAAVHPYEQFDGVVDREGGEALPPGKPLVHDCVIGRTSGEVACQYKENGED